MDLFQGQLRSTLTCCNKTKNEGKGCGRQVRKWEPFMYLTLPLKGKQESIESAIDDYCQEEVMDGDNSWYCSTCKGHVRATKKFDIWKLPPILIVHLKRFAGRGSKINSVVRYPTVDFDLESHIKSPNLPESTSYDVSSLHSSLHIRIRFLSLFVSLSPFLFLSLPLPIPLSLTHIHIHTCSLSLSLSLSCSLSLCTTAEATADVRNAGENRRKRRQRKTKEEEEEGSVRR